MRMVEWLRKSPLWLLLPAIAVAGVAWAAVMGYEPLVFDPSLYETEQAHADELVKTVEPDESAKEGTPAEDVEVEAAPAVGALADGTWTGYAACGTANPDGWKPYYVAVSITVSGGKVTGLNGIAGTSTAEGKAALNWDAAENQSYLDKAVSGVQPQIAATFPAASAPSGVDTVSGATYSSVAIYNAYVDALAKSAAAAGSPAPPAETAQPDSGDEGDGGEENEPIAVDDEVGALADGTWTGYAECGKGNEDGWKEYYVGVTVEVIDGAVKEVADVFGSSTGDEGSRKLDWDEDENGKYLDWAISGRTMPRTGAVLPGIKAQIEETISSGSLPAKVDVVSGATYSSKAVFSAFYEALGKSAVEAGSSVVVPPDGGEEDGSESGQGEGQESEGEGEGDADADSPVDETAFIDLAQEDVSIEVESIFGNYADGTYRGYAYCKDFDSPGAYTPYYLFVEIVVEEGRVVSVNEVDAVMSLNGCDYDYKQNDEYLFKAINGAGLHGKGVKALIQEKLDAGEEVADIDVVSGATWSSKSIYRAFFNAIRQAIASSL